MLLYHFISGNVIGGNLTQQQVLNFAAAVCLNINTFDMIQQKKCDSSPHVKYSSHLYPLLLSEVLSVSNIDRQEIIH